MHATAGSLVLIGRMWTTCRPKPYFSPPSPPPICPQSLTRDIKGPGVGRGRSRCWSSPVSCAPTEFSHGSDPSLRNADNFMLPNPHTELFKKSPQYSLPLEWKSLDDARYIRNRFMFKTAIKFSLLTTVIDSIQAN